MPVEIIAIERKRRPTALPVSPHAADGLRGLLGALARRGPRRGQFDYVVPPEHTDGIDEVTVTLEIG
jgi:hypothetical protein